MPKNVPNEKNNERSTEEYGGSSCPQPLCRVEMEGLNPEMNPGGRAPPTWSRRYFLLAGDRCLHLPEGWTSSPPPHGMENLVLLRFGLNKTLRTPFQTSFIPAKTTERDLPRAVSLKCFNPGCISKGIQPYGSHSFTLNSSRCRLVEAS